MQRSCSNASSTSANARRPTLSLRQALCALATHPEPLLVRSAFEMPEEQRATVQSALKEILGAEYAIRFESVPDLVSGIEIIAGGQKLAWSISDYLGSLERDIEALVRPISGTHQQASGAGSANRPEP